MNKILFQMRAHFLTQKMESVTKMFVYREMLLQLQHMNKQKNKPEKYTKPIIHLCAQKYFLLALNRKVVTVTFVFTIFHILSQSRKMWNTFLTLALFLSLNHVIMNHT